MRRIRAYKSYHRLRLWPVVGGFALGFCAILVRLYLVQIIRHAHLHELATQQYTHSLTLRPERGRMLDRYGQVLATSLPVPSVYAIPHEIENLDAVTMQLAQLLHMPHTTVWERLRSSAPFVWLARQITPDLAASLQALKLKGVEVLTETRRYYPNRHLAGQILGFVGVDGQGLGGLEYQYDRELTTEPRRILLQRDAIGRWVRQLTDDDAEQPRGADLYVTLDTRLQYVAEKEIAEQVQHLQAESGLVVMMQPQTGDILAMAAYPYFNPNLFHEAKQQAWQRNRGVTDPVEPGSTFKLVVAAAALEEKAVRLGEQFFCEHGAIRRGHRLLRDYKPYDYLSFTEVFAQSSNIGTVKIGERLSSQQFYHYIKRFGFGEKTQIDLPAEHPGLLRPPQQWSDFSHDSLALGQEITVTPIQLVTAYAAIANGGWLMHPRLVERIVRPHGEQVFAPQTRRRILSQQTTERLTAILTEAVAHGTGHAAAVEGYTVAGKTGTAQKIDPASGIYSHSKVLTSFIGYVPTEAPQLVILVMVDEPQRDRWGSQAAAPVFQRVAQQALHHLQIPPQYAQTLPPPATKAQDPGRRQRESHSLPLSPPGVFRSAWDRLTQIRE
jgi:cell division protein FtsI (penicillin-binding protein 3)